MTLLAAVLVMVALIPGIPSVWKGKGVLRLAVVSVFVLAVMLLFLMV